MEVEKRRGAFRVGALRYHARLLHPNVQADYFPAEPEMQAHPEQYCVKLQVGSLSAVLVRSSSRRNPGRICAPCLARLSFVHCMRRSTALALLASLLIAGFTPFLQALTGVQPHACCLRRLHAHTDHDRHFSRSESPGGNCCPPLTSHHSALLDGPASPSRLHQNAATPSGYAFGPPSGFPGFGFSDRAPPA